MALIKLEDFNPNYRNELLDGMDIRGWDVYAGAAGDDKIGTIKTVLVDDLSGRLRYFVVDTGFWIFGKQVLLPVGRSRIDESSHRVYAIGIPSKQQAENLPEYREDMPLDYNYEEQVRRVYRMPAVEESAPVEGSTPLEAPVAVPGRDREPVAAVPPPVAQPYDYEREPELYGINERDHRTLKLYEERLIANKRRQKTGEVAIGKHVETETVRASVPIEKERVVIERTTPETEVVAPGTVAFGDQETIRMETYEEHPDVRKETVVREEVEVRKEVERDLVTAEEELRREELDIHREGTSEEQRR